MLLFALPASFDTVAPPHRPKAFFVLASETLQFPGSLPSWLLVLGSLLVYFSCFLRTQSLDSFSICILLICALMLSHVLEPSASSG